MVHNHYKPGTFYWAVFEARYNRNRIYRARWVSERLKAVKAIRWHGDDVLVLTLSGMDTPALAAADIFADDWLAEPTLS